MYLHRPTTYVGVCISIYVYICMHIQSYTLSICVHIHSYNCHTVFITTYIYIKIHYIQYILTLYTIHTHNRPTVRYCSDSGAAFPSFGSRCPFRPGSYAVQMEGGRSCSTTARVEGTGNSVISLGPCKTVSGAPGTSPHSPVNGES